MTDWSLDTLAGKGATLHAAANLVSIDALQRKLGAKLPAAHSATLLESNGLEVFAGYFRIFGIDTAQTTDVSIWNAHDYWKFAWGKRCDSYWCFAETAWGDQYAYALDPLRSSGDERVYLLDALSMNPLPVASSFAEFFKNEFVESATAPYDETIVQARSKFGPLKPSQHLMYAPSPVIGGDPSIETTCIVDSRTAMIINGDIATQVDHAPPNAMVGSVEPYEDQLGRARLRLVWAV